MLVNLTRDHWVTDNEIDRLFSILNKQCDEFMCVVCTPDKYVNDFFKSKCNTKLSILTSFFYTACWLPGLHCVEKEFLITHLEEQLAVLP